MTKKDYLLIANCIVYATTEPDKENDTGIVSLYNLIQNLNVALYSDNNKFEGKKFHDYVMKQF